jgi:uncharacterized protein YprB with RNaseH-like and TPR domain
MREEIQSRLRRMGVVKGARTLKQPPIKPAAPPIPAFRPGFSFADSNGDTLPLEMLLPGSRVEETEFGPCLVLDHVYPLSYHHGADCLAELCAYSPSATIPFGGDGRFDSLDFRDFVFLDTETTGLVGAGTVAFMVGVAFFDGDALVVRQYFLRDYDEEPAMLLLLSTLLESKTGLVTFNGRAFDAPLLENRFLLNRLDSNLTLLPHLDLLPPSRRLWRTRLGSCRLVSLEKGLLDVQRTQEDVPGWAIPQLYFDYLRSGDGQPLVGIFYHNELDILSMVTLAAHIVRQFHQPNSDDHALDLMSLGSWQASLGLLAEAEQNLRLATSLDLSLEHYHQALHQLGSLLKRNGRPHEAAEIWQQIASTSYDDIQAHVELAKHYEWAHRDMTAAITWTRRAIDLLDRGALREDGRAALVRPGLERRLARLERKQRLK